MSGIYLRISIALFLVAIGSCPWMAAAQDSGPKPPSSEETDVILLLDASGSMRITDPERMRDDGAKVLFQFLKSGDRLGIIQFDEEAKVIRPLSAFRDDEQGLVSDQISQVDNSGLYTDLHAAILSARKMLDDPNKKGAKVVVLLSDGKMDPNPENGEPAKLTARLLEDILPQMKESGIKLYSLAFSTQADKSLLSKLAEATDGVGIYAEQPADIQNSFSDLFLAVKKPQVVPLRGHGFQIDAEVSEATFYIKNEHGADIYLVNPHGANVTRDSYPSSVTWYEGKQFEVITITVPEVGNWEIKGLSNTDGFATVLTKLKLVTDWPPSILAGGKKLLQVRLYDDKKPVVLPNMSDTVKFNYQVTPTDKVSEPVIRDVLYDDGTHGDEKEKDGIFSTIIRLEEPGQYKLRVIAKGPTFEREQQIPFRVKDRLVSLEVVTVSSPGKKKKGKDYFRVRLGSDAVQLKDLEIKLSAKTYDGQVYALPLEQMEGSKKRYEVAASILPQDGEYELEAEVHGLTKKKKSVHGKSQKVEYKKASAEGDDDEPHVSLIVTKNETKKEEEKPVPVIPYVILVTLINAGAGAFAFMTLKKSQNELSFSTPKFEPGEELLAALASLDELAEKTEIEPDDPRLLDMDIPEPPDFSGEIVATSSSEVDDTGEEVSEAGDESSDSEEEGSSENEASSEEEGEEEGGEAPLSEEDASEDQAEATGEEEAAEEEDKE